MKYLMVILLAFIVSCEDVVDFSMEKDVIYFQFEYVNHAWGYQHTGFIIDVEGNIYEYEQPVDWNWSEEDKIKLTDFKENLNQADISSTTIESAKLYQMLNLALKAKDGKLSEFKSVMADGGGEGYYIYTAQEGDANLTKHLLQLRGDNYQKNTSSAADEITDWLIEIRGEEGFSDEHF